MRKLHYWLRSIVTLAFIVIANAAFSQVYILNEDFSSSSGTTPPSGWSNQTVVGGPSDLWKFDEQSDRILAFPILGKAAIFDSRLISDNGAPEKAILQSRTFDASISPNCLLTFDQVFAGGNGGGTGKLEVFNGLSWILVDTYTDSSSQTISKLYNISSIAGGVSNARLRFTWQSDAVSGFWAIDNIRIYSPLSRDGGILSVTGPIMPFQEGTYPVQISLANFGIQNINSAVIRWSVNGVTQTDYQWSGNLPFGQSATNVTLGQNYFFAGKRNEIKAWIISINQLPDLNEQNDTTLKNLYASFCGSYTLGGINEDFINFNEVTAAINIAGVLCPVTFVVKPGIYNEQIRFNAIPGSTATNSITFISENNDSLATRINYTLPNPSNDYTILMNGTNHVHFDGLGITRSNGQRNIQLTNNSSNLSFSHCYLGKIKSQNQAAHDIIFNDNNFVDSIYFVNNITGENIQFNGNKTTFPIYLRNWNQPLIRSNTTSFAGAREAFRIEVCKKTTFQNNRINISNNPADYNPDLFAVFIDLSDSSIIAGNQFTANGGCSFNIPYFLKVANSSFVRLVLNNVNVNYSSVGCGNRPTIILLDNAAHAFVDSNLVQVNYGDAFNAANSSNMQLSNNFFVPGAVTLNNMDSVVISQNVFNSGINSNGNFPSNLQINNNTIIGGITGMTNPSPGLQIVGNNISAGTVQVYLGGDSASISGNTMDSVNLVVQLESPDAAITNNTIENIPEGNNGISVSGNAGSIFNNRIIGFDNAAGIESTGENIRIYNNFIAAKAGVGIQKGISLQARNNEVYFNNVLIRSTDPARGKAIEINNGNNQIIKNNNFINKGGGYACYISGFLLNANLDYNNYFSLGNNPFYLLNANRSTFNNFKSVSNQEANGSFLNAYYVSDTNLIPTHVALYNSAENISGIELDIDSVNRNNQPDRSAIEFELCDDDGGLDGFYELNTPITEGLQPVKVILRNHGNNPLSSIQIHWKINDQDQTPFQWTGSLLTGQTDTVTIGNYLFQGGILYQAKAFTMLPNLQSDCKTPNDSISRFNLTASLCGLYTIGGNDPNYSTIADAATALNVAGISCPVVFKVREGNYAEQVIINKISGTSSTNTITFESASGISNNVLLSYEQENPSNNYSLLLDSAQYLIFKNIQITRPNGDAVSLIGKTQFIQFDSCVLQNVTGQNDMSFLTIQNSTINGRLILNNNQIGNGLVIKNNQLSIFNELRKWRSAQIIGNHSTYSGAVQLLYMEACPKAIITDNKVMVNYDFISYAENESVFSIYLSDSVLFYKNRYDGLANGENSLPLYLKINESNNVKILSDTAIHLHDSNLEPPVFSDFKTHALIFGGQNNNLIIDSAFISYLEQSAIHMTGSNNTIVRNNEMGGGVGLSDINQVNFINNQLKGSIYSTNEMPGNGLIQNNDIIGGIIGFNNGTGTIKIINNHFANGQIDVNLNGNNAEINNNRFDTMSVQVNFDQGGKVVSNTFTGNRDYETIIQANGNTGEISKNQLLGNSSFTGMKISADFIKAYNNFVHGASSEGAQTGLLLSGNNCEIYFNTIQIKSTDQFSSRCLQLNGGSNNNIRNNNISNEGEGYAIYYDTLPTNLTANNNNLYSNGITPFYYDDQNISDFSVYQSITGYENNGYSINPYFINPLDPTPSQSAINNKAISITGINTDIGGAARGVQPDIGAKEFFACAGDIGIDGFFGLNAPVAQGLQPIRIILRNQGSTAINTATLSWKVNNINQPGLVWNGTLQPADTAIVSLGNYNILAGQAFNFSATVSNPNNGEDCQLSNNSAIKNNVVAPLCGEYTLGGADAQFPNFTAAANALNFAGIACPVIFKVRTGNYNEHIRLLNINGSSIVNTISFESENSNNINTVLNYQTVNNASDYTIILEGSAFINFKNISIKRTNGVKNILFKNNAHDINFVGCTLDAAEISSGYSEKLNFIQNTIYKSLQLSNSTVQSGLVLQNNVFKDNAIVFLKNWRNSQIEQNNFTNNIGKSNFINIESGPATTIKNNQFLVNSISGGSSFDMIRLLNTDSLTFTNNIINSQAFDNFSFIRIAQSFKINISQNQFIGNIFNSSSGILPVNTSNFFTNPIDAFNGAIATYQVTGAIIKNNQFSQTLGDALKTFNSSSILFENNKIQLGSIGLFSGNNINIQKDTLSSGSIYSYNGSLPSKLTINNCTINGNIRSLNGVAEDLKITANQIINGYLDCSLHGSLAEISNNIIQQVPFNFNGMTVNGSNGKVEANKISGLDGAGGIKLNGNNLMIINNFIAFKQGLGVQRGIEINNSQNTIAFNSIQVLSSDAENGVAMMINNGLQQNIKNNIISNAGGGYAIMISVPLVNSTLDFNDYYSTTQKIAKQNNTNYNDFNLWRNTFGIEPNGKYLNPIYASNTELRPQQRQLNGAGVNISNILLDIDGEIRSSTAPDPGADEFMVDFGITELISPTLNCFQTDTERVTIAVRQFGDIPFIDLKIAYQLNNGTVYFDTIPGSISSDLVYTFRNRVNLSQQGTYLFKIWLVNNVDDNRNNDTLFINRFRQPSPVADFSFITQCANVVVPFTATATVAPGFIDRYEWNFGDGSTGLNAQTNHIYELSGNYNVALRVFSDQGCYSEVIKPISITTTPNAQFSINNVCNGTGLNISNQSGYSGNLTDLAYSWNFGDGTSSNVINPSHAYADSGNYNVQLIISSNNGCADTLTKPVIVFPVPEVYSDIDRFYYYNQGAVTLTGFPAEGIFSGRGLIGNIFRPDLAGLGADTLFFSYFDPNTGCGRSISYIISIINKAVINNQPVSKSGCVGSNISLSVSASGSSLRYQWYRNNQLLTGRTTSILNLNNVTTANAGSYYVKVWNIGDTLVSNTVNVTVYESTASQQQVGLCNTETYMLPDGLIVGNAGTYTSTITNYNGCDSIITTIVTKGFTDTVLRSIQSCENYQWNGQTYDQSGTYTWIGQNTAGCDSIVILTLTITNSAVNASSVNVCGSFTWSVNGQTYNQSGSYTSVTGCNTEILNLTITPSSSNTANVTTCGSYTWIVNGQTYNQSGSYSSVTGCNTEVLNLTITPSTSNTTTASTCDSYTWSVNGQTYNQSGSYTSVTGCITEVLNITITPSTSNTTNASACDSYIWNVNGQTYSQSGSYTSITGCNTEILNLTITPSTSNTTSASACDSYTWTVNGQTYTQSGSYTSVTGCNTVVLNLTITPSTGNTTTASACDVYVWSANSQSYTQSGTYTAIVGCVTEILNLTITQTTTSTSSASACDSYTWSQNGQTYTQTGTYQYVVGCQVYVLNLTITPSTSNTTTASACDIYTWSVNGQTYTQSGSYSSVSGCHTEILNLTITPSTSNTTTASACDTYTWSVNGQTYTQSGSYSSISGCNTEILNLTITPSTSNTTTTSACDTYTWSVNGQTYTQSGSYSSLNGCNTEILNLTITPSTSNTTTASACDSYIWSVNGQTYSQSGSYTSITECNTEILNITITPSSSNTTNASACGSYTWSVNGQTYTQSGTYTYVSGCNTQILNLTINTSSIGANGISASANNVNPGTPVTLTVTGGILGTGASWKWYSTSCGGTAVGTGNSVNVSPTITTTYFVRAEGSCNTTTCYSLTIIVKAAGCAPTGIVSNATANTICSGRSVTLTAQGTIAAGATWKWYKGSCGGSGCYSIGTGYTLSVSPTSTTTYFVRSEGGSCGTTACTSITITVLKVPAAPTSINGTSSGLCNSSNIRYTCTTVTGATSYAWVVPNGASITSGQGTNSILVSFNSSLSATDLCGANNICVKAVNSCGSSSSTCINISLTPVTPSTCSMTGPSSVTCGQLVTYSIPVVTGASSYTWVLPSGWTILNGQGTNSISVKAGCSRGEVKVTPNNACGSGNSVRKTVSIRTLTSRFESDNNMPTTVSVWPVPARDILYLDAGEEIPEKIEIMDATGKRVYQSNWRAAIDISRFASGIYYVRVYTRNNVDVRRVEVVK